MTTTTDTTREPSQTAETAPEGTPAPEATDPPVETGEGNREAAKYRTKLRAAEAERDRLAERLAIYQRRDAEALVGDRLLSASELWVGDATKLEDLLADDGTVDKAKVDAAVAKVLGERPYLAPKGPRVPRDMGQGQRESAAGPVRSFAQILRDA